MINPSVQLTFPCPACAHHLTLRTFTASGPCPTCGTLLSVSLSVSVGNISLSEEEATPLRKFDERRFRPVLRPLPPPQNP